MITALLEGLALGLMLTAVVYLTLWVASTRFGEAVTNVAMAIVGPPARFIEATWEHIAGLVRKFNTRESK